MPDRTPTTRLAPSPTGALHLGNARTFLVNWLLARRLGWRIVMRMEDLAGPRVRPEAIDEVYDILTWLGIDWDEGPWVQSHDLSPYVRAMERLAGEGRVYPCELTRTQIEAAAAAPNLGDPHEPRFDPALRPPLIPRTFQPGDTNWRFAVDEQAAVRFEDAFAGTCVQHPGRDGGDFVVWTRVAQPAYQLAVVVDDARQGITEVVRADDLLASTGRQRLLHQALALGDPPRYWHLPLVIGPDGRRLAKRHGDTRISAYREGGVRAERVLGLLAHWCAILPAPREITLPELVATFDIAKMSREPITFDQEADQWLRSR